MPIKDLTDRLRPPRLGKIRLGEKSEKGYPVSLDHFACPEAVQKVYGTEPKELEIMFISDNIEDVFPVYYKMYGQSSGLKCRGDGITASELNKATGDFDEIDCKGQECDNYEGKQCRRVGALKFLLPKVDGIGVWEIDTGSVNSILNIYSLIGPQGLIRALTSGRIRMIPFTLHVERREVQSIENGQPKKRKVTILELRCNNVNLSQLMKIQPKTLAPSGPPIELKLGGPQPPKEVAPGSQFKLSTKVEELILDLEMCSDRNEFLEKIGKMSVIINSLEGKDKEDFLREKMNIEARFPEKKEGETF